MRDEAEKRIGHLYPKVEVTADMAKERSDLKPLVGKKLTIIAWLWARTVKSPNPAFAQVDVPLASTFMLSTKVGKEAYVEPVIEGGGYRFHGEYGQAEGRRGGKERHQVRARELWLFDVWSADCGRLHQGRGQGRANGTRLMTIVARVSAGGCTCRPPRRWRSWRTARSRGGSRTLSSFNRR